MRVLHDLGQASLGANGIAVDTRNVARMLSQCEGVDWTGLLTQHDGLSAARLRASETRPATEQHLLAALFLSAVSGTDGDDPDNWGLGRTLSKIRQWLHGQSNYETAPVPAAQRDAAWRTFFSATMSDDAKAVLDAKPLRWSNLTHTMVVANSDARFVSPLTLDTTGYDVYLTAEPRPVKVSRDTLVMHRYHDAIPIAAADTMPTADTIKYHFLLTNIAQGMKPKRYFVCNSEPTKRELLSMWPQLGDAYTPVVPCAVPGKVSPQADVLSPTDIARTRLSDALIGAEQRRVELLDRVQAKIPDEFPYILAVAALEPKKNIPGILRAYEQARMEMRDLKLIIVGNFGWKSDGIEKLLRPQFLAGNVIHLQGVPYAELQALYKRAHCLVYPSLAEGFGLPPVEAMVCGAPSVCSDIPSLRWVMGDAALYGSPYDAASIARGIIALKDPALRKKLIENGRPVIERFSLEAVGLQWKQLLDRVSP